MLDLRDYEAAPYLVLATRKGQVKKTALSAYDSPRQGGVIAINLADDDEVIGAIASAPGKTPGQVTLRWHIERGDIVFPQTTHVERMRENFDLFDFELSADEVAAISALDQGEAGETEQEAEPLLRRHPGRDAAAALVGARGSRRHPQRR